MSEKAIDRGGGQACDVEGVKRELKAAGFTIIRSSELRRLRRELRAHIMGWRIGVVRVRKRR